jgi:hypothetical protein
LFDFSRSVYASYCHIGGFTDRLLIIGLKDLNLKTVNKAIIILAHEAGHIFGSKTVSEDSPLPERIKEEILAWKSARELIKGFFYLHKRQFLEIAQYGINSRTFKLKE